MTAVESLRITDEWGDSLTLATLSDGTRLEVKTSRGVTVQLDELAVDRLRAWLRDRQPRELN